MEEFNKCRFCSKYNDYEGCTDDFCCSATRDYFIADTDRIIEKSKEKGISVSDVISLMNLT